MTDTDRIVNALRGVAAAHLAAAVVERANRQVVRTQAYASMDDALQDARSIVMAEQERAYRALGVAVPVPTPIEQPSGPEPFTGPLLGKWMALHTFEPGDDPLQCGVDDCGLIASRHLGGGYVPAKV